MERVVKEQGVEVVGEVAQREEEGKEAEEQVVVVLAVEGSEEVVKEEEAGVGVVMEVEGLVAEEAAVV